MGAILLGIGMFMFLVLVHELGHFIAAKKTGVKVLEFGIGIPPKAFRVAKDKQGTEYTVNWLPLGGFVRLKGENPDDPDTFNASDSFIVARLWKKIVILLAGVAVNFLFAWLFFSLGFMHGLKPINILPDNAMVGGSQSYLMPTYSFLEQQGLLSGESIASAAMIDQVSPDSLAEQAGLVVGDQIVSLNGEEVTNHSLSTALGEQFGKTFTLEILHDEALREVSIVCPEDSCVLGVSLPINGNQEVLPIIYPGLQAFAAGWREMNAQTKLTFSILGKLGANLFSFNREKMSESVNKLSGPVGIVKVGESIFKSGGIWMYLAFAGMISLALAIFNVLPIPALDGGRVLGVLIQAIGRVKPEKYFIVENYFNLFFFVLLMGLGVYIILMDLVRFWGVNIPFLG